jgi:hypothetical protein
LTHFARSWSPWAALISPVNYVADPRQWLFLLRTPESWRALYPVPLAQPPEEAVRLDAPRVPARERAPLRHRPSPGGARMRLALFDDQRLGVVVAGGLVDVTGALPWPHDPDPVTAGWWRRLCRDLSRARPALERAAADGTVVPLDRVRLRAPVLNPSKVIAAASNYAAHVEEMHGVQQRTLGRVEP